MTYTEDELDALSDYQLEGRFIYRRTMPDVCGHRYMLAVYGHCKVAGRVAIDHYVCAICETNKGEQHD